MKSLSQRQQAFSLVELIAVIALIALFAGLFSLAVLRLGSGSLEGAERLAGSQFNAARNLALLRGTEVRVLIQNDSSQPDLYRRQLGIIYQVSEAGETEQWVAYDSGVVLPEGYYFVPEVACAEGTLEPNVMRLDFPRLDPHPEGEGSAYYYFKYNSKGMATPGGQQVVLEPGRLEPDGEGFSIAPLGTSAASRKARWGGFLILRLGGLLYFPNSDAIQGGG